MANKVIYKLKGHEKFPLREGWLTKGIMAANDNLKIFTDSKGPDVLGVGTNMVKSIRYWLLATKLIERRKNTEEISPLAKIIFEKDPYLEDVFSLWLIHSNLVKNIESATVWYMFFNKLDIDEFNKSDLQNQISLELFKYIGASVNEGAVKDDIDVLLNMYSKDMKKYDDPEEKNVCPLSALGLIRKEEETYMKVQPDLRKLNDYVILYELSCMFQNEKSLSIEKIATGEHSLGAIYHLTKVMVNKYLDNLEALGCIKVDRTAGLDVVYPVDIKTPIEIVRAYYK